MVRLTGEGGKFGGMRAAQFQTISVLFSTRQDTVEINLTKLGESLTKNLDLGFAIQDLG